MQVKKQQLELDMEHRTGSKIRKEYVRAVYCQLAYLTYTEYIMHNEITSWNQDFWEKYQQPQICRCEVAEMAESKEELKSLLMRVKEESEKTGLKLNIQKVKIMASGPITSWQIEEQNSGSSDRFYFLGLQNQCRQ